MLSHRHRLASGTVLLSRGGLGLLRHRRQLAVTVLPGCGRFAGIIRHCWQVAAVTVLPA